MRIFFMLCVSFFLIIGTAIGAPNYDHCPVIKTRNAVENLYNISKNRKIEFSVQSPSEARILIFNDPDSLKQKSVKASSHRVEVVIGGHNTISSIYGHSGKKVINFYRKSMLCPTEYRSFWIDVGDSKISVGRAEDATPFMEAVLESSMTNYGISSSYGTAYWKLPCSKEDTGLREPRNIGATANYNFWILTSALGLILALTENLKI